MNLLLNLTGEPKASGVTENTIVNTTPIGVGGENADASPSQERMAFSMLLQQRLGMHDLSSKLPKSTNTEAMPTGQTRPVPAPLIDSVIAETGLATELPLVSTNTHQQEWNMEFEADGERIVLHSLPLHYNLQANLANTNRTSPEMPVDAGIQEPVSGKSLPPWAVTEPPQFESDLEQITAAAKRQDAASLPSVAPSLNARQQNFEVRERDKLQSQLPADLALDEAMISADAELVKDSWSKQESWLSRSGLTPNWRLTGNDSIESKSSLVKIPMSEAPLKASSDSNEEVPKNLFEFDELLQWSKVHTRATAQNDKFGELVISKPAIGARAVEASTQLPIFQPPVIAENASVNASALDKALPIFSERFADALGAQSLSLAKNGMMRAELRLDPPELGPLDIQIDQEGLETKLHFIVHQSQTKDHVEAALHRLREIFESGGLKLTDVTVEHRQAESQGSAKDGQHTSRQNNNANSLNSTEAEQDIRSRQESLSKLNSNLFDEYA